MLLLSPVVIRNLKLIIRKEARGSLKKKLDDNKALDLLTILRKFDVSNEDWVVDVARVGGRTEGEENTKICI